MQTPTYVAVDPHWLVALDALHSRCHELPKDFEDVLMTSLTRRDYALILVALDVLLQFHPCLGEDLQDLVNRMIELRDAQKSDWIPERA